MYNTKNFHRHKNPSRQQGTAVWNEILIQFRKLPKDRQDEILMRIYKRVSAQSSPVKNKHFSLLLQAKA